MKSAKEILNTFFDILGRTGKVPSENIPTPYKVYVATFAQAGTNAPVATVLENTIGNIIWARDNAGAYTGTLANAFPIGKTISIPQTQIVSPPSADNFYCTAIADGSVANLFYITTFDGTGMNSDDILNATSIRIEVYP